MAKELMKGICLIPIIALAFAGGGCSDEPAVSGPSVESESPTIDSVAPDAATEGVEYIYVISCNGGEGDLTLEMAGDCGGALTDEGEGRGSYRLSPSEEQGGTTCSFEITCSDGSQEDSQAVSLTIIETNAAPIISDLPAEESGLWGREDSFAAEASDPDLPANVLSWSVAATSCSFAVSVNADSGIVSWICNGMEDCSADITVTDDGDPAMSDTEQLTIHCTDSLPQFSTTAPDEATEGSMYVYDVLCTDPEGDGLSLSIGASDSCSGRVSDAGDGSGVYTFLPSESQGGGQCRVHLLCSDGELAESQTTDVSVIETNAAPGILNLPATEGTLCGNTDSFSAVAADEDIPADVLSWSLVSETCGFPLFLDSASGELTWACGAGEESCIVDLSVTDDDAVPLSDVQTLSINCLQQLQEITSAAPDAATEGEEVVYSIEYVNQDFDPVSLQLGPTDSCGGMVTDNGDGTGSYTFVPDESLGGSTCTIHIVLGHDSQLQVVSITENNEPPVITNLPTTEAGLVDQADEYQLQYADPDEPPTPNEWSITDDSCTFAPDFDNGSGLLMWTCAGSAETCTARVTIADQSDGTLADTKEITIVCSDSLPAFDTTPPDAATEDIETVYELSCTDPEGDDLSLDLGVSDSCGGELMDDGDGTGSYSFTPDEEMGGSACTVHFICSDGEYGESQIAEVTIVEDNKPPQVTNLPAVETGHWDSDDSFGAEAMDLDVPPNSLTWSVSDDNCDFSPSVNPDTGVVSWTCGEPQVCSVLVTATDGGGLYDGRSLTIECSNGAPVLLSSAPDTATESVDYQYALSCSDPEGNDLFFAVGTGDTCGGSIDDNGDGTGTYSFTPAEDLGGGSCDVQVYCSDDYLESNQPITTVTVFEDNQAPLFENLPDVANAPVAGEGSYDVNAVDSADTPANNLTYSIQSDDCSFEPSIDPTTGVVSWTCSASEESCEVNVSVHDDGTPPREQTATLSVECMTRPTVVGTQPDDSDTDALAGAAIEVEFSRAIDCNTMTSSSFTLNDGLSNISGMLSCDGATATFVPTAPLFCLSPYTATIAASVSDEHGIEMAADYSWSFETGMCHIAFLLGPDGGSDQLRDPISMKGFNQLTVYAALHDKSDSYLRDVEVDWSATTDFIADGLSQTVGTHTTFRALQEEGEGAIVATHADFGTFTTPTITVDNTLYVDHGLYCRNFPATSGGATCQSLMSIWSVYGGQGGIDGSWAEKQYNWWLLDGTSQNFYLDAMPHDPDGVVIQMYHHSCQSTSKPTDVHVSLFRVNQMWDDTITAWSNRPTTDSTEEAYAIVSCNQSQGSTEDTWVETTDMTNFYNTLLDLGTPYYGVSLYTVGGDPYPYSSGDMFDIAGPSFGTETQRPMMTVTKGTDSVTYVFAPKP